MVISIVMDNGRELLGQPNDIVSVDDINVWGTLPSLPQSLQSSFVTESKYFEMNLVNVLVLV